MLILSLGAAALTHNLGLEAALGAFVLGILAGQSRRFSREAGHTLLRWTLSKVEMGEEEAQRLQQEEQASHSFI